MKFSILLLLIALLIGCQSSNLNSANENSDALASEFLSLKKSTESTGFNYIIRESAMPGYVPHKMGKIASTLHAHQGDYKKGALAMKDLITEVLNSMEDAHDFQALADIQLMAYSNFDFFISKMEGNQPMYASENLRRLMSHTEPIEWKVLARMITTAKPLLTQKEINSYSQYILLGIERTRENNLAGVDLSDPQNARLLKAAEQAAEILTSIN